MAGTSVAAAFEDHAPPAEGERAEAVATGRLGGNAPASRRRARSRRDGWAQQDEGRAGACRRKVQPAAHGQIELTLDRTDDRRRGNLWPQGLFHCPQRVLVEARLYENKSADIETKVAQSMAIGLPAIRKAAPRGDQQRRTATGGERKSHQCGGKAEGRGPVAMGCRNHLMERAACQTRTRKVPVDLRQPEWQPRRCGVGKWTFQLSYDPSKSGDLRLSLHENPEELMQRT